MTRLRDRNRQIPNGFKFLQPETGFEPQAWSSFDTICRQVLTHRQGNQWLAEKHGWNMTMDGIAAEVDLYNAKLCQTMGWNDFITVDNDSPPAFPKASLSLPREAPNVVAGNKVTRAVAGLKLITDWLGSGLKPVAKATAEARAKICLRCPQNRLGDFWQRLEATAAAEVKTMVEVKNDMELSVENEKRLYVCKVCDCFLPLKVHVPIEHIRANTSPEVMAALDPKCWIPKE